MLSEILRSAYKRICMFYAALRTNNDYFPIQY